MLVNLMSAGVALLIFFVAGGVVSIPILFPHLGLTGAGLQIIAVVAMVLLVLALLGAPRKKATEKNKQ